jgi:class 3 adenylate cyclase
MNFEITWCDQHACDVFMCQDFLIGKSILDFMTPLVASRHRGFSKSDIHKVNHGMSNASRVVMYSAQKTPMMCSVHVEILEDHLKLTVKKQSAFPTLADTIPDYYKKFINESPGKQHLEECPNITCVIMDLSGSTEFVVKHGGQKMGTILGQVYQIAANCVLELYPYVYVHELIGDSVFLVVNAPFMVKYQHANALEISYRVSKDIQRQTDELLKDTDMFLRVGIASGPVTAGVVDGRTFRLFGPTVHLAQRLESACPRSKIAMNKVVSSQENITKCNAELKGFGETVYYVV